MPETPPPVFDREHLARYTGGEATLEAELIGLLDQQIEAQIAKLRAAETDEVWAEAAHTLKGAARGVGAMALGDACERAENAPRSPHAADAVMAEAMRFRAETARR